MEQIWEKIHELREAQKVFHRAPKSFKRTAELLQNVLKQEAELDALLLENVPFKGISLVMNMRKNQIDFWKAQKGTPERWKLLELSQNSEKEVDSFLKELKAEDQPKQLSLFGND